MSLRVLCLPVFLFALCGLLAALPSAAQPPSLCEGVDDCPRVWTTGGDAVWFGQTAVTSDGADAAQSGDIEDDQLSYMEIAVTGPAEVAFLWKVSSEESYDFLAFSKDGTLQNEISGNVDWAVQTCSIEEGEHSLRWEYSKDESASHGLDAGFVDRFTVLSGGTGSVRTVITPEEVVTDDAQWALDGGDWQDSGTTLSGVPEGAHTVTFAPVAGWETPHPCIILVRSGETGEVAGDYYRFCDLVDACQLDWTASGDALWMRVGGALAHDGVDAAQTGPLGEGQTCAAQTTVTGPATVGFWWRTSCEESSDYLRFYVDGALVTDFSGDTPWRFFAIDLGGGSHTLKWAYEKDSNGNYAYEDAGWLDQVMVADGTPGDLTVNLLPAGAVDAGAQWSVDDGATWNDSGDTLSGIPSGLYTVTFLDVGSPWNAPQPLDVLVPAGGVAATSGVYKNVCEGLGACNRDWTLDGGAGWFTQTAVSHDGYNACQNEDLLDNESASMSTTVTGPVSVSFWWKVSSESGWDFLTFYVDDVSISAIAGAVDWAQVTHDLSDGPHTLTWTYSKDGSESAGADAGWVDQFLVVESDPPTGSVVVNGGAARTATPDVLLDLTWDDGDGSGVSGMRFSNNGSTWSAWQKPAAQKTWILAGGDGTKTVRAQFRDKAGNVSPRYTDAILLDQTPPTGSIVIGSGAFVTDILEVMMNMAWDDGAGSGVSRMRFSDNGSTWSAWEPVAAGKVWTLPGWGYRTVRVQFRDRAGNVSTAYNDYIKAVAP